MNPLKEACYSREQHERLVRQPRITSSDSDIQVHRWLLIDCDPRRPAGVSATDEEKARAQALAMRIRQYLRHVGFAEPILGDSGNGYHLLYAIQVSVADSALLTRLLSTLDDMFSTEAVSVDRVVFNPSRITKLYGTVARKGAHTDQRPHRVSRLIDVPQKLEITPAALLEKVAGAIVIDDNSGTQTGFRGRQSTSSQGGIGDMEAYLDAHGLPVKTVIRTGDGCKYVLQHCPFNADHKAPDAAVFVRNSGAIGFKCFHNSCAGHRWQDVRARIDPTYGQSPFRGNQYTSFPQLAPSVPAPTQGLPKNTMLDIADIPPYDRSHIQVIRSGFARLDGFIGGFNKGELSVWSGSNASGKSTLVSQLALTAAHQGFKTAIFSGEMNADRVKYWLYLQAAGRRLVERSEGDGLHYQLKTGIQSKLDDLLRGMIGIYNNDYGSSWHTVRDAIVGWIKKTGADMVIIDNLMALSFTSPQAADKYDQQSAIVKELSQLAKQLNIHIHFICHPRKALGFLRKDDISGTADITNAADNVFMVHRNNADFLTRVKTVYPNLKEIPPDAGNVVEIMKNRDMGVCDRLIFLFFDPTCKTMTDVRGGLPMYGWAEELEGVQSQADLLFKQTEITGA